MRTAWVSTVWRLAMATGTHRVTLVAALREFCLDTLDLIGDDGLPFAEKGPFLAFFGLFLRARFCSSRSWADGGNHEMTRDIFQEENSEGRWGDRMRLDRCDLECYRKKLGSGLTDCLGGVVVEGIACDAKTLGIRIGFRGNLGNIERVGEVAKGWRIELDAANIKCILILADCEVDNLDRTRQLCFGLLRTLAATLHTSEFSIPCFHTNVFSPDAMGQSGHSSLMLCLKASTPRVSILLSSLRLSMLTVGGTITAWAASAKVAQRPKERNSIFANFVTSTCKVRQ